MRVSRKRRQAAETPRSRLIVNCRDASYDRLIPTALARAAYDRGIICQDLTNGGYCTRQSMVPSIELVELANELSLPYSVEWAGAR